MLDRPLDSIYNKGMRQQQPLARRETMKATKVKLSALTTFEEHLKAIESIEHDYENCVGGIRAWRSGYETYLTDAAKKKIAAIEKRIDRLFPIDEDTLQHKVR